MTNPRPGTRAKIKTMATRAGGVSVAEVVEIAGIPRNNVTREALALCGAGCIFRGKRAGERLRWFSTSAARDAWVNAEPTGTNHNTVMPRLVNIGQHITSRARKPGLTPLPLPGSSITKSGTVTTTVKFRYGVRPTGDEVIPVGVKITRGPSYTHDPRVQCAPDETPWGGGFAAVGVGRCAITGRAWSLEARG